MATENWEKKLWSFWRDENAWYWKWFMIHGDFYSIYTLMSEAVLNVDYFQIAWWCRSTNAPIEFRLEADIIHRGWGICGGGAAFATVWHGMKARQPLALITFLQWLLMTKMNQGIDLACIAVDEKSTWRVQDLFSLQIRFVQKEHGIKSQAP